MNVYFFTKVDVTLGQYWFNLDNYSRVIVSKLKHSLDLIDISPPTRAEEPLCQGRTRN